MSIVAWKLGDAPRGPVPGAAGLIGRLLGRFGPNQPPTADPNTAAVLFDMDGLLIDSEPLWTIAEEDLAASFGRPWTEEIKAACIGTRIDASVPIMLTGLGQPLTAQTVAAAEQLLMRRMTELFAEHLPLLPGARELLDELKQSGTPCALVSSSYRILVDACLTALGDHPFTVSIAGDEVEHAKPHPQPYLLAAAALGVDAKNCVVLEDSVTGATAGVAAGCTTLLIPGDTVPPPTVNGGWTVVTSLIDLSAEGLQTLSR